MGFFSWECKGCGLSILGPYELTDDIMWMNICVAVKKGEEPVHGYYDGYGRIEIDPDGVVNIMEEGEPELYHHDCWEFLKNPKADGLPSKRAQDQGYFLNINIYNQAKSPLVTGIIFKRPTNS